MTKLFLGTLLFSSALAFANNRDNPSDKDSWFDITVLKATVRTDLTLKNFDKVENCRKFVDYVTDSPRLGKQHFETFDCRNYIAEQLHATPIKEFPSWNFLNGHLTSGFLLDSPLVEIETVIPEDRLAQADFVAFSESFLGGRVNLFKANGQGGQTREERKVILKDGRTGIVHKWVACFEPNGQAGANILRTTTFKPALVRQVGSDQLRYWDSLIGAGDYTIKNYHFGTPGPDYLQMVTPNSFDRSAEVLR